MTDPVNAEDDLVGELRESAQMFREHPVYNSDGDGVYLTIHAELNEKAADRIAALEAVRSTRAGEIERYREALTRIRNLESGAGYDPMQALSEIDDVAHQALNQGTDNVG